MPRPTDTKARIQQVARELFARRGVQQTSLRDIADVLGITKPALYYHFDSRESLVSSIVQPLLDDMDAFIGEHEAARLEPRALLSEYFDLLHRNRELIAMLVRDLSTMGHLDLVGRMLDWRRRLLTLLLGPSPPLAAQVQAVVAIGGMSDCTVEFPDVPMEKIKTTAIDAACAALGLAPSPPTKPTPPTKPAAKPITKPKPKPASRRSS